MIFEQTPIGGKGNVAYLVGDETTRELVIIDASDVTAEPVARVHLPVRVPAGFHGSWIADAQ